MPRTVSPTDREIIRMLQQNARASFAELSRQTGDSRVDGSQENGAAAGARRHRILDDCRPGQAGLPVTGDYRHPGGCPDLDSIAATVREMDEVDFAAFVTGSVDIIVHVIVQHQEGLVDLLQHLSGDPRRSLNRNIRHAMGYQAGNGLAPAAG